MQSVYKRETLEIKERLDKVSPTICLAKWLWVSLHLPQGLTQSCYHPKTHKIPLDELEKNVSSLHNTNKKKEMRKMMLEGDRPSECSYCWKIEDSEGHHLSDRYYRSGEWWAKDLLDYVVEKPFDFDISPTYVEVNFNQACNFKCCYCSPHLSTTWESEIREFGEYELIGRKGHNNIKWLDIAGLMPIKGENPYIDAFWEWWPELYKTLKTFRMTGGEPLIDHNTFKILEYIIKKPNKNLEISITSNLCPPSKKTWTKFIDISKRLIEAKWKVLCIHKFIELKTSVICAIIEGKHYFITDDKNVLDDKQLKDIFEGKKNTSGDEESDIIKYAGIMNFRDFLGKYPIGDFGELFNSDRPKDFGNVQVYTIYNTFEKFVINKDFYRDKQLKDLEIFQHNNITIEECKSLGFKFDDEDHWFNQDVEHTDQLCYSFAFNVTSPAVEHLMVFVSLDSVGKQLEYSRFGADYNTILNNVKDFLMINKCISITFINTFNLFSIYKLKDYLKMILELRNSFNTDRQKIWVDFPILETPKWICISNCKSLEKNIIKDCIQYMKDNIEKETNMFKGFKDYEIDKLQRNLDWIDEQNLSKRKLDINKANFYLYFKEYDKRRDTNIIRTFPELESYYKEGFFIYKEWRLKNNE